MSRPVVNAERDKTIAALYRAGRNVKALADSFGVSPGRIRAIVCERRPESERGPGLHAHNKFSPLEQQDIYVMRQVERLHWAVIAAHFGGAKQLTLYRNARAYAEREGLPWKRVNAVWPVSPEQMADMRRELRG